ncbi:MAG: phosphocholine cytidylyltransferase family protein [Thermodesulfovibrionales bacterium]
MKAIILAAGASRRLKPLTDSLPKCLIEIGNRSILEHQLDAIDSAGIKEAVIVVGYLKEKIKEYVGNSYRKISSISYVENPEYSTTNTIYSLYLARNHFINEDFIYFNADVLLHRDIVILLVNHIGRNVLAVEYKPCGEEEVKFTTDPYGRIIKLGKQIPASESKGEFIGVGKFSKGITRAFIDALEYYSLNGQKNLFFEKAVEDILKKDVFLPLDVTRIPNIEIDFPEDLERAEREIYPAILSYGRESHKR